MSPGFIKGNFISRVSQVKKATKDLLMDVLTINTAVTAHKPLVELLDHSRITVLLLAISGKMIPAPANIQSHRQHPTEIATAGRVTTQADPAGKAGSGLKQRVVLLPQCIQDGCQRALAAAVVSPLILHAQPKRRLSQSKSVSK